MQPCVIYPGGWSLPPDIRAGKTLKTNGIGLSWSRSSGDPKIAAADLCQSSTKASTLVVATELLTPSVNKMLLLTVSVIGVSFFVTVLYLFALEPYESYENVPQERILGVVCSVSELIVQAGLAWDPQSSGQGQPLPPPSISFLRPNQVFPDPFGTILKICQIHLTVVRLIPWSQKSWYFFTFIFVNNCKRSQLVTLPWGVQQPFLKQN